MAKRNLKTNPLSFLILLPYSLLFPLHATHASSNASTKAPPHKNTQVPIIATVIAAISLSLVLIAGYFIFRCIKRTVSGSASQLPSNTCRLFSLAEIRAATNNFDEALIVGKGGFGDVYKGHIDACRKPVAMKRLKPGSEQGAHEFQTEINMLSQFRHPHLVSLIGYCSDGAEMVLVYDFMARGTLRDHLYGAEQQNHHLSWERRLKICLAAARGLHFLHAGVSKRNVIHRDVKSTNILLDEEWVAKVSDFGLSKVGPNCGSHVTTDVKGSLGYLDPEYYMSLWLTQKSDVYSFGVVLLEVLCGRAPIIVSRVEKEREFLVTWVKKCYREGNVEQTLDPVLKGSIRPKCLKKFLEVALSCLNDHGKQRPMMSDVVKRLEYALCLQRCGNRSGQELDGKLGRVEMLVHEHEHRRECSSSKAMKTCSDEEEQALVHGNLRERQ